MFCQLEVLRHCLAPSLRRQLNELPKSLDETYERVLKEIESTHQGRHARRLLACLAVAIRPLSIVELAEVLAFDLDAAEAEVPAFHAEWRWEDQEQAVLSACSSLISVVDGDDSRVVQFSHFSVKEYLMSNRLASACGDISLYHILPEPAHLKLAHTCLGVLLNSDNCVDEESEERSSKYGAKSPDMAKKLPLLMYSAEHWVSHAEVGNVASFLKDAIETLFDINKPYFLAWIRKHDIDRQFPWPPSRVLNPLYCAALCGFRDLVQHLVVKHPEHLNQWDGIVGYPLVAALSRKHFRVAELLVEKGAYINVRGNAPLCQLIQYSSDDPVDAVQFLLKRGADVNATEENLRTPLFLATLMGHLKVAQMLLEQGAEVDPGDKDGQSPLHLVSNRTAPEHQGEDEGGRSTFARILVERGADAKAHDRRNATPLHFASYHGRPEIVQLLLDHGANVQSEDILGRSPLHEVSLGAFRYRSHPFRTTHISSRVYHPQKAVGVALLLLERGADVNALDEDHATPLHLASSHGLLEIAQLLLDHGATANTENVYGQTPLHVVSRDEHFSYENPNIARLFLELNLEVNAQDKSLNTPLHFACSHGNFKTALVLLDHGAHVNARNSNGQTPMHRVPQMIFQDSCVAQLMLERGAEVNARDKDLATPLHVACFRGCSANARALLDHGADVNARNTDDETPLHRASRSYDDEGYVSILRPLLERGADVNARDKYDATPLHLTSCESKLENVRVLLDYGADPDAQNADGQTPLHRASPSSDHRKDNHDDSHRDSHRVVQLLLERGVNVNARDKGQGTPLHLASYNLDLKTVRVLLDNGAEADARNADGQTPLHLVSQSSQNGEYDGSRVAQLLLERGVDVDARDNDQATPLHLVSHCGHANVAKVLLDNGAQVGAEDVGGQTPLHRVLLGHENYKSFSMSSHSLQVDPGQAVLFVQQLLERGADVNARNKDQETPLHLASHLRLHQMARFLLNHGADVGVKDSEGKTPLQLASGRKGKAMKRLLLEYSAKA